MKCMHGKTLTLGSTICISILDLQLFAKNNCHEHRVIIPVSLSTVSKYCLKFELMRTRDYYYELLQPFGIKRVEIMLNQIQFHIDISVSNIHGTDSSTKYQKYNV